MRHAARSTQSILLAGRGDKGSEPSFTQIFYRERLVRQSLHGRSRQCRKWRSSPVGFGATDESGQGEPSWVRWRLRELDLAAAPILERALLEVELLFGSDP